MNGVYSFPLPPGWIWKALIDLIIMPGQYGTSEKSNDSNRGVPILAHRVLVWVKSWRSGGRNAQVSGKQCPPKCGLHQQTSHSAKCFPFSRRPFLFWVSHRIHRNFFSAPPDSSSSRVVQVLPSFGVSENLWPTQPNLEKAAKCRKPHHEQFVAFWKSMRESDDPDSPVFHDPITQILLRWCIVHFVGPERICSVWIGSDHPHASTKSLN